MMKDKLRGPRITLTVSSGNLIIVIGLTGIFTLLKICKVIDWSWLWVFSPLWIDGILLLALFIITIIMYIFLCIADWISTCIYNHRFKDRWKNDR